jgi:hypothetical protein
MAETANENGTAAAQAGAGGGPGSRPARDPGEDPTAFILDRTRSEVHLLLDNISANPDVTISALAERVTRPADLPENWIHKVCEITWPPATRRSDSDEIADQAALLITARDYLNGLAKPASGATIAFTLMVTQEENPRARRRRMNTGGTPPSPSRSSLAGDAYPDLVDRARHFRQMMSTVVGVAIVALALTLMISWYLAIGNAALADYGTARAGLTKAGERVGDSQTALYSNNGDQSAGATGASAPKRGNSPQSSETPPPTYYLEPCHDPGAVRDVYPSAQLRDACLARAEHQHTFNTISRGLSNWALGAPPEFAAWWANLLGTAVLPVLYGFLGAIASVVRTWSRKIKASLLSPRDMQLSLQQLALGALVGACISLFIAAPAAGNADTALLGPVALSSSAISFVAGFGVDSVFQALEALISRIFNIAPAGTVNRPDGRASN